jgi:hypothetical protein
VLEARTRVRPFAIGDAVMIERPAPPSGNESNKLRRDWEGPYLILGVKDANNFVIDKPGGEVTVHMQELKPYAGAALPLGPQERRAYYLKLDHDPAHWRATHPAARRRLTPDSVIGQRIRVFWPQLKGWFDGIVSRRLEGKRHEVHYFQLPRSVEDFEFPERLIGFTAGATRWKLLQPKTSLQDGSVEAAGAVAPLRRTDRTPKPRRRLKSSDQ